jgi:hypothetical protein
MGGGFIAVVADETDYVMRLRTRKLPLKSGEPG